MFQEKRMPLYLLGLMGLVLVLTNGCKKEAPIAPSLPVITTAAVTNITQTTASAGGAISSNGGGEIREKGLCWAVVPTPTMDYNKTSGGSGSDNFASNMTGLAPNTVYYVRAYATNAAGTAYGNEVIFTTSAASPPPPIVLSTAAITNIAETTASGGGTITNDAGQSITARGVCWSEIAEPTIANNKTTNGSGIGSFTSSMTGLVSGTTYYVRAYATNAAGTAYGNQVSFTTNSAPNASIPTVVTLSSATNITQNSASCGATVTNDGGANVVARGLCWSTTSTPTTSNSITVDGSGTGSFTGSMTGLVSGTTYYVRAYATNSIGTAYGNQISFTTMTNTTSLPTITTTTTVSNITAVSAFCGGNVSNQGGTNVIERGLCWSASTSPTIANSRTIEGGGIGSFTSTMIGLTVNTMYYVRAYATNSSGTAYGNQVSFTTSAVAPVAAIGDTYQGGIVFYVDATGQHGLIAAPNDEGTAYWGCQGGSIIGTGVEVGTGQANTDRITGNCSTAGIAARICEDLILNGKNDWYLPSKDELKLMYQNLYTQGLGNFVDQKYWSSSQVNAQNAWTQPFDSFGAASSQAKDITPFYVRPIRSF